MQFPSAKRLTVVTVETEGWRMEQAEADRAGSNVTVLDKLGEQWEPKIPNSVRSIPYGFDEDVVDPVEGYGADGGYTKIDHAVARRVEKSARYADGLDPEDIYPHCLRATAATEFAYSGLSAFSLCAVMGWNDLSVVQKYVRMSGGRAADELGE